MTELPHTEAFRRLVRKLVPEDVYSTSLLGAGHCDMMSIEPLLQLSCGTPVLRNGGGLLLDSERAAAAMATVGFAHNTAALHALGPEGLTDGHTLLVSTNALRDRGTDRDALAQWVGDGAVLCAQVAMGVAGDVPQGWTVVTPDEMRQALGSGPHGTIIVEHFTSTPEQDAWRYASAMMVYAPSLDGPLAQRAQDIPDVPLDDGGTNLWWSDFLAFEGEKAQWRTRGTLRKGLGHTGATLGQLIVNQDSAAGKYRMACLVLSHFTSEYTQANRVEFLRGFLNHPNATKDDAREAIEAAAIFDPVQEGAFWGGGWSDKAHDDLTNIRAQEWFVRARTAGAPDLHIPGLAGLIFLRQKERKPEDRVDYHADTAVLRQGLSALLSRADDLPPEAVRDLITWAPIVAAPWLAGRPGLVGFDGMLDAATTHLKVWLDTEGPDAVAQALGQLVAVGGDERRMDDDHPGWLNIIFAAPEHPELLAVIGAGVRGQPAFAREVLMVMASDPDTTPAMVQAMADTGVDVFAEVPIAYADGTFVPERIVDVGRRHESLAVRAMFRRMANEQQAPDNVVVLRSPKARSVP